jgi:D-alanyl-D-alanine dipeptidase
MRLGQVHRQVPASREEQGMKRSIRRAVAALLTAAPLLVASVAAAEPKAVGRYKDWRVYTQAVGRDLVCYAAVEPSDVAPREAGHGEVSFYVASWRSGAATA